MKKLSHINEENKPQMVDVSKKDESSRVACAQTVVVFPEALSARFKDGDIKTKKGTGFLNCNYCRRYGCEKNA